MNLLPFTVLSALGSTLAVLAIVLVAVIVLLIFYVISVQRRLVRLDEMLNNTLGQIAVQVNSRWDALTQLAKVAVEYAKYESETLINVIKERRTAAVATDVQSIEEQSRASASVLDRLFAVAENYPELKSNALYQELMASIDKYENNVRIQRMVYNDAATRMNSVIRMFPSSIVASMLGFSNKAYFTEEPGKSSMPELNLSR